jgi:preprotein translocase subunit SecA
MLNNIKLDLVRFLSKVQVRSEQDIDAAEHQHKLPENIKYNHPAAQNALSNDTNESTTPEPYVRGQRKVGRNELCPCGSGKKYKHCHGKLS